MRSIVIIGALRDDPNREELLSLLSQSPNGTQWDWIQAPANTLRPKSKYIRHLQKRADQKKLTNTTIVKLKMLRSEIAGQIKSLGCRVVEAPIFFSVDELVEWIVLFESKLIFEEERRTSVHGTDEYVRKLEYERWEKNGKPGIPPNTGGGFYGGQ